MTREPLRTETRRAPVRRLYRSRTHRVLAGVAGGIAEYFGIDPLVVRVLWVVGGLLMPPMTVPTALLLYAALALIIPLEPSEEERTGETGTRSAER